MKHILFFFILSITPIALAQNIEVYSSDARESILAPAVEKKNLSGLTFNPHTKSYYAIINRGDRMYEFDQGFNLIREIEIKGFKDPEDLSFVRMTHQGPEIAIADETGAIYLGILPGTNKLLASSLRKIQLRDENGSVLKYSNNKGLEGITYIPNKDIFFVVQEKPIKAWSFKLEEGANVAQLRPYLSSRALKSMSRFASDLSAVSYLEGEEQMVFLSDEGSSVIFTDLAGNEVKKVIHLKTKLQHEGLSFSEDKSMIYVASEPYYLLQVTDLNIRREN